MPNAMGSTIEDMRANVQRVLSAEVRVEGAVVGACGIGLLVFVAAHKDDTDKDANKMADRIAGIRIFNDAEGKMNLALKDVGGSVLAVSNFTLYGEAMKSRRPSFLQAASYERGAELFNEFVSLLRGLGIIVETGVFGADMQVSLVNDGPVTLSLDTKLP